MPSARLLIASSHDSNMLYATGLHIPDPFIWVRMSEGTKSRDYLLVSSLELSRAKQECKRGTKIVPLESIDLKNIRKPSMRKRNLADYAASFMISYNITEVLVPSNMWTTDAETLKEHGLRVKITSPFFPSRQIKHQDEIAMIKRTGLVTKKAFYHALAIIKESKIDWNDTIIYKDKKLTSEYLKNEIEKVFLENGCVSGETIVSCGEDASQPHNRGCGPLYAGQPIVMDIFPKDLKTGYYFDMTRTVIKGTPSKELKRMFDAVRRAQLAGIAAVKAGRKASDVHKVCQDVFDKQGYKTTEEEGFIHSTGHGVGIDIHEQPGIGPKSEDILQAGMVITIEPGLYYKELGGVRIEDTIVVTKTGHVNLTNLPRIFYLR